MDRREGRIELLKGVHRWVLNCNWKLCADNFAGDGYHTRLTHASMDMARGRAPSNNSWSGWSGYMGNGHGSTNAPTVTNNPNAGDGGSMIESEYYRAHQAEAKARLGEYRAATGSRGGASTVFPNFSHQVFVRNWHPRGSDKTEVWSYCYFEKDAPQEVKDAIRMRHTWQMGPSGNQDQDDMNNWAQCTDSGKTFMGKKYPINQQLGLGRDVQIEGFPGIANARPSELCQREYYEFWAQLMEAPSWSQVKLTPRTVK